jgi:hypothetical protein
VLPEPADAERVVAQLDSITATELQSIMNYHQKTSYHMSSSTTIGAAVLNYCNVTRGDGVMARTEYDTIVITFARSPEGGDRFGLCGWGISGRGERI